MKGLLLKDFIFLRSMKSFLLFIAAIGIALSYVNNDSGTFALGYITFLGSFMSISSINADRANDGYAFLFSLPVARKTYVAEKYLFSLLTAFFFCAVTVLCLLVCTFFMPDWEVKTILLAALWTIGVSLLMACLFIPVQLKFQDTRARMVIMIVIGFVLASIIMFNWLSMMTYFGNLAHTIINLPWPTLTALCLVALALCFILSYKISVHVMEKKVF